MSQHHRSRFTDYGAQSAARRIPQAVVRALWQRLPRTKVLGPGVAAAGVAGEVADRAAELFVAGPAEPDGPDLAGLMLSLYRSGRQAEALEAYRRAREVFADELGIDPGRDLQDLEAAVLAHHPRLDWTPPPTATSVSTATGRQRPPSRHRADGRSPWKHGGGLPVSLAEPGPSGSTKPSRRWSEVHLEPGVSGQPRFRDGRSSRGAVSSWLI